MLFMRMLKDYKRRMANAECGMVKYFREILSKEFFFYPTPERSYLGRIYPGYPNRTFLLSTFLRVAGMRNPGMPESGMLQVLQGSMILL